jgi:hypothetical protein
MAAHNLVPTLQNTRFLEDRRQKSRNIDQGLLNTPAMTSNEWKEANYFLRHLYTKVAAHGLHHRICATKAFHSPSKRCQCTLCGGLCNMYHIIKCTTRTLTLSYYTNSIWYLIYTVHSVFNKSSNNIFLPVLSFRCLSCIFTC